MDQLIAIDAMHRLNCIDLSPTYIHVHTRIKMFSPKNKKQKTKTNDTKNYYKIYVYRYMYTHWMFVCVCMYVCAQRNTYKQLFMIMLQRNIHVYMYTDTYL